MAQEEKKRFEFSWRWTSIIPIAALGIVEAAVWLLTDDFPKWARFQGVAHSLTTIVLGLFFIGGYTATSKWKALNFVWWGLGLLFIGAAVSPFVWPEKAVEILRAQSPLAKTLPHKPLRTLFPRPSADGLWNLGKCRQTFYACV